MLPSPSLSDLESFWNPSRVDGCLASAGQIEDSEKDGVNCTEKDREDEFFFPPELEKAFKGAGGNKCCSNHFQLGPKTAILYYKSILIEPSPSWI